MGIPVNWVLSDSEATASGNSNLANPTVQGSTAEVVTDAPSFPQNSREARGQIFVSLVTDITIKLQGRIGSAAALSWSRAMRTYFLDGDLVKEDLQVSSGPDEPVRWRTLYTRLTRMNNLFSGDIDQLVGCQISFLENHHLCLRLLLQVHSNRLRDEWTATWFRINLGFTPSSQFPFPFS